MKVLLISIFTLLASFFTSTTPIPKEPKTEGIVTYTYQDFGPLQVDTYLYFNENKARYNRHHEKSALTSEEGYLYEYPQEDKDWYYYKDSLSFFVKKDGYPNFFATWKNNQIEWEITEETQIIQGLKVTKATTNSLYYAKEQPGITRTDYGQAIAWFTTEIPITYGPDGYHGLPGLIVKLEYTGLSRSLKTTLKSIEYKEVEDWQFPNTNDKLKVTQDQAYNWYNYGQKWFKKKAKEMGIE